MSKPSLYFYTDWGQTNGQPLQAWSPDLGTFRKTTGAKWGVRVCGGDEPDCLKLLPEGYRPTGPLAHDPAVFARKSKLSIY
jgi:hypothetical protein